jgi:beta-glucosidase/6-phospho-beta-glucosidase/beta-galactosidase
MDDGFNYQSAPIAEKFMFATGIENSCPTISLADGKTKRRDELAETRHYKNWCEDFELVKDLGIRYLRYGGPYYTMHLGPGRYDWSFTDQTFAALQEMEIVPITDLCHFGLPDWLGNFQNPEWPEHFADFARAFAERYPWVRLYTPVNEIYVAAHNSAQVGWWNERLKSERGFVTAIKHLCRAALLAQKAIDEVRPDAIFIQSEATQLFHAETLKREDEAAFLNSKRYLGLDLIYGHPVNADVFEYLLDNGMTREEYDWFRANHMRHRCVMGNDYYTRNEHMIHADGSLQLSGEILGYYVITHQYYERYRLPVMHTETNWMNADEAPHWLEKQWQNVRHLKLEGVPVLGFTWYSLTDQVDWDTSLREYNQRVNPLGLCDLDRKLRPVGKAYKQLIERWKDINPMPGAVPARQ